MIEPLSFEAALAELEKVVERLQQPEVPLEEAVSLFRRGAELANETEELLSSAELHIQQLTQAVQERFEGYVTENIADSDDRL